MVKGPGSTFSLLRGMYHTVFPGVSERLVYWRQRAADIPNEELRRQALASIEGKTFHCEGGASYALLNHEHADAILDFIVAYQTISDYLDNLCDRSTSLDPIDFTQLHLAMTEALQPNCTPSFYYLYREDQLDHDYLVDLVKTCQNVLRNMKHYPKIQEYVLLLAKLYSELQVHKHVDQNEREFRLQVWYRHHRHLTPDLDWYEFSACTGSTIGIFCLVSAAHYTHFTKRQAKALYELYFPYFQGLHILLDYFIDQQEDEEGGDLNFCYYYPSKETLVERFSYISKQVKERLQRAHISRFHHFIYSGLYGIYLSDPKSKEIRESRQLIHNGGMRAKLFYWNRKLYEKVKVMKA